MDGIVVRPVITQYPPLQKTSQENNIVQTGTSQTKDTANNTAVETRTVGREAGGDGHDSESDFEEIYRLFRTASTKPLSAEYSAAMKAESSEDSYMQDEAF